MKKLFAYSFILAGLAFGSGCQQPKLFLRNEFRIRDPFVLPDGGTYYLYEAKAWAGGIGVNVRRSKDLEHWTESEPVLKLPPDIKNTAVWAPEVHKYAGAYWIFATLTFDPIKTGDEAAPCYLKQIDPMLAEGFSGDVPHLRPRGVWVFRSDRPDGPFTPVKTGPVTPEEWMCLDGTLWVEDGVPWMIFCHEWCQTGNGRMMAAPMSPDLKSFTAKPIELFRAACLPGAGHVTDGPFLVQSEAAGLRMIWSNFLEDSGYCVLQCKSQSGKIAGPWTEQKPLYSRDGGHGMLFKRFDGQLMLSIHQPNSRNERMQLFPLRLTDDGLACD